MKATTVRAAKKTAEPSSMISASYPAPARRCWAATATAATRPASAPHCHCADGSTAKTIHGRKVRTYDIGDPRALAWLLTFLF